MIHIANKHYCLFDQFDTEYRHSMIHTIFSRKNNTGTYELSLTMFGLDGHRMIDGKQ